MGKLTLYLAFTILFLNNTSLYQLCKIPVLIQHYLEHRELDQSVDLLDFLSMHYWGSDINDNDDDRDKQLPFKEFNMNGQTSVFVPAQKYVVVNTEISYPRLPFPILKNDHLPDPILSSLFRPPKDNSLQFV